MGQVLITKRVPQTNWLTAILLEEGLIRKSAGIEHAASGKPMTWGPEEILNPPEDHPWYDKGPDGDWESDIPGMKAHHPVYGYDPVTGKLMFNKDGTPLGKHPIDAVAMIYRECLMHLIGQPMPRLYCRTLLKIITMNITKIIESLISIIQHGEEPWLFLIRATTIKWA